MQNKLFALSDDSEHLIAERSSHMVIIDQPETVIRAIRLVIQKTKSRAGLKH